MVLSTSTRKMMKAAAIALLGFATAPMVVQADPTPVEVLGQQVSLLWVCLGAFMVVFMQAGFALVETGMCRAKNAAEVMAQNFAIFGLGFCGFYFVGFAFAFGGFSYPAMGYEAPVGEAAIGSGDWVFLWQGGWALTYEAERPAIMGLFLYMVAFMDTTATIPTGSMAERWNWTSFTVWGIFCGAFYYPIFAAWTWGGGWLAKSWSWGGMGAGYVDFAGSGVVHTTGGVAALVGAWILGPRLGKYDDNGKPVAIPPHHIPMAIVGTFILLFGWFGFNAASTLAVTDIQFATAATNTCICGAFGAVSSQFWVQYRTGKPDPSMMVNGMLAGLVTVTAPCAFIPPWASMVLGVISGVCVIESAWFVERKLKIDDPVGAISVHFVHGSLGVIAVGTFSNCGYGAGWNGSPSTGVCGFFWGGWDQLGAQLFGLLILYVWDGFLAYAFFKLCAKFLPGGIRSKPEDELAGLDMPEFGSVAYPDFQLIDHAAVAKAAAVAAIAAKSAALAPPAIVVESPVDAEPGQSDSVPPQVAPFEVETA